MGRACLDPEPEVEVRKPEPQLEDEEIMLTENLPPSRATFLDWYVYSGGNCCLDKALFM